MAVGDRLQIADKPTLDLTKADTTEILERIGDTGGGTGDSVVEMLQTLLTTPNVIKSIQYGVATLNRDSNTTVSISTVNVQKSVVLLNGGVAGAAMGGDTLATASPYLVSFTNNSLIVGPGCTFRYEGYETGTGHASYQVVEFY